MSFALTLFVKKRLIRERASLPLISNLDKLVKQPSSSGRFTMPWDVTEKTADNKISSCRAASMCYYHFHFQPAYTYIYNIYVHHHVYLSSIQILSKLCKLMKSRTILKLSSGTSASPSGRGTSPSSTIQLIGIQPFN